MMDILSRNVGMLLPDELTLYAHLLAEKKAFQPGLILYSFAEKLRGANHLPVPPLWHSSHQRTQALLQDHFSENELESLWQKGQSMSREDIPAMLDAL